MKVETLFPHKTFLHQNAIDIEKLPEALRKRIYGFEELEQDLSLTIDEDREKLLSRMEDLSHELDEDLEEHFEDQLTNNDEQDDDDEPEKKGEQAQNSIDTTEEVKEENPGYDDEKKSEIAEDNVAAEDLKEEEDKGEAVKGELQDTAPSPPEATEYECSCKHAASQETGPEVLTEESPATDEPITETEPEPEPEPVLEPELKPEPEKKELSDEDILATLLDSGWNKILPEDLRKKGFRTPLKFRVIVVGRFYLRRGRYDTHYKILRGWE